MHGIGIGSQTHLHPNNCGTQQPRGDGWIIAFSHELAQSIAAIALHGQASKQWLDGIELAHEEARANIDEIVQNALRAGEILRRIRALSGSGELELVELDLNELMATCAATIESELIWNNVRLCVTYSQAAPRVSGDSMMLATAILNLLRNGLSAMARVDDRALELRLRSCWDARGVRVTVTDNGVGMDGRDLDLPFRSFFTTEANGMGVGLSLCRAIVELHGGSIWAENNDGHGAAFHIVLPRLQR
ncbi:HAMP domain-containing histidine kinase [Starkeya sp. ORNL1]|uniref:sensor histidine kinase n=1 Tax=Starkeya sp. ORNL1 TaxID=2709380 RepID=UPI001462F897|nr:HAMP domain-containing sensor histidine kinase [Starkeya sp. ORNL1]QJP14791.1 HAMP domain-containing histidine kinase [Starkeya sp. ORNL1]